MPNSYIEPAVRPTAAEQLSFLSVLNFVLRNFLLLVVPGLLLAGLLYVRMVRAPRTYSTTTTFSAGDVDASPRSVLGITLPGFINGKGPQFYIDLIGSPAILDPLVETRFDVAPGSPPRSLVEYYGGTTAPRAVAKQAAMDAVTHRIHTKITQTSGWVIMSVTAERPSLAVDLAKAVLAEVDSFNTNTRKQQSLVDRQFASAQLTDVGAEVRTAEDALTHFLETNRDIAISPALQIERERLTNTVATKRSLYATILQQYDREKMDAQRETKLLTIIGPPTVPFGPDRQVSLRLIVIGLFVGSFLGALLALCREYFKHVRREGSPQYGEFAARTSRFVALLKRPFVRPTKVVARPEQSTIVTR
jgi:hypothetical protein